MNLEVLKKPRKKPKKGDVFVFQHNLEPNGRYRFGKVIRTDASIGGFANTNLIYIYNTWSETTTVIPKLNKNELLVPPLATNNLPWSRGYFETIGSGILADDDVLAVHCFEDYLTKSFFDDNGATLSRPVEPIGEYGLQSFLTISDMVTEALRQNFDK